MFSLERIYKRDPNLVTRVIADEVILVPIRQNVGDLEGIYVLNTVGHFIWDLLDGTLSAEHIKKIMVEEYDVGPNEAEADLATFLMQMEEIGAVSWDEMQPNS